MYRRVKILVGCIVTISLIVGAVHRLGVLLRPVNTDVAIHAIDTFHDMPENSFEVIGYGSSHMWSSMDPMVLYDNYGIGAYNYGCNWQRINTTKLFFEDSLRTQSPKIILIETYLVNSVQQDTVINGEIYYTRAVDEFEGKRSYLKQCFGTDIESWLSYYMPLCAFHDNWTNLDKRSFESNSDSTDFNKYMGYLFNDDVMPVELPKTFVQNDLAEESIAVLDAIVEICDKNDIEIIFFTTPMEYAYPYGNAMTKYAREHNCVYINFFEYIDEIGLNPKTDFYDAGHLNANGAGKISNFLGEYIVNNYNVTDMRNIENNIWEAAKQ